MLSRQTTTGWPGASFRREIGHGLFLLQSRYVRPGNTPARDLRPTGSFGIWRPRRRSWTTPRDPARAPAAGVGVTYTRWTNAQPLSCTARGSPTPVPISNVRTNSRLWASAAPTPPSAQALESHRPPISNVRTNSHQPRIRFGHRSASFNRSTRFPAPTVWVDSVV